jgi:hypothetical protein
MIDQLFSILVKLAEAYLLAGLVVAGFFFARWLKAVDPAAVGGNWGFRVLITPGVIVLWPVVVMRVFCQKSSGGADGAEALRRNHRLAFLVLTLSITFVFTAALVWRAPAFAELPVIQSPVP